MKFVGFLAFCGGRDGHAPAIIWVGPALDEAIGDQGVHQAGDGGRSHLLGLGQIADAYGAGEDDDRKCGKPGGRQAARRVGEADVRRLVEAGARRDLRSDDGSTPADLARREHHQAVIDVLDLGLGRGPAVSGDAPQG